MNLGICSYGTLAIFFMGTIRQAGQSSYFIFYPLSQEPYKKEILTKSGIAIDIINDLVTTKAKFTAADFYGNYGCCELVEVIGNRW